MDKDKALRDLRALLADEDFEPEPYVDLRITVTDKVHPLIFSHVRGIHMENGVLTFEDEKDTLFFVPNVLWWSSSANLD